LTMSIDGAYRWTGWQASNCRSWCWSDSCHGGTRRRQL